MRRFIGRGAELKALERLKNGKKASLIVIRGRRRIGKSRLAEEMGRSFDRCYTFTGLPPEPKVTAEDEIEELERQLHRHRIPLLGRGDWGDIFWSIAEHCKKKSVLVVLDEISWMGSKDPKFLGKLKIIWDQYFCKNPKLMLIISGSNSTWIDKNILSSTGFVGRISQTIDLKELPLSDCRCFWGPHISSYEMFKILGVTGGVPRYLEEIDPKCTAEQNLINLCFTPGGLLLNEFDQVFSDLFSRRSVTYKEVVCQLIDGPLALVDIAKKMEKPKSGELSACLDDLCQTGFLTRDFTWQLKRGALSKLSRFRLSDNYVRFYLKYIEPVCNRIGRGEVKGLPVNWFSILGLQFENLVINNKETLFKILNIPREEVVAASPYFQTQTKAKRGCQVDFLIQTRFGVLYVCEIKFKSTEVSSKVIQEVEERIKSLKVPKGFSVRPVLIHVNGVSPAVIQQGYFAEVIDFAKLLG